MREAPVQFANAGIVQMAPLGEISEELFDRKFDINVQGTLFTVNLKGRRIRVNVVSPGPIDTPALRNLSHTDFDGRRRDGSDLALRIEPDVAGLEDRTGRQRCDLRRVLRVSKLVSRQIDPSDHLCRIRFASVEVGARIDRIFHLSRICGDGRIQHRRVELAVDSADTCDAAHSIGARSVRIAEPHGIGTRIRSSGCDESRAATGHQHEPADNGDSHASSPHECMSVFFDPSATDDHSDESKLDRSEAFDFLTRL